MARYMCKIVVLQDEWPLSDKGYDLCPDADKFARNTAWWFAGDGKKGNFLAYSTNMALTGKKLAASMAAEGHTWTCDTSVPMTLETLNQYDGLFLADNPVDTALLTEYCKGGGNVFIVGGTKQWVHFNPFVKDFGFAFADQRDSYKGPVDFQTSKYHPIMKDVQSLYMAGGSEISDISPDNYHDVLIPGFLGVYDYLCKWHTGFKDHVLLGVGDKVRGRTTDKTIIQKSLWYRESLYHTWKEVIEDPSTNGSQFCVSHVAVKYDDGSLFLRGANTKNINWRKNLKSDYEIYATNQEDAIDLAYEPWFKKRVWVLKSNGQLAVKHHGDQLKWWQTDDHAENPNMPEKMASFSFGAVRGGNMVYINQSGLQMYQRSGWEDKFVKAAVGNVPIKGFTAVFSGGFAGCGKSDGELYVRDEISRNGEWLPCPTFGIHIYDLAFCPQSSM